jgi:hypothetical protein
MRLYSTNFSTKQAAQNDCSFMERHSLQFHNIRTQIPEESQAKGFYSLLFLAQALGKQNTTDEFQITVISNNLQSVTGLESLCPEKGNCTGAVKVIPQEYPNISCRSIDVALPSKGTWEEQNLTNQLLAELTAQSSDSVIAYRGLHRWVQTFEPVRLNATLKGHQNC